MVLSGLVRSPLDRRRADILARALGAPVTPRPWVAAELLPLPGAPDPDRAEIPTLIEPLEPPGGRQRRQVTVLFYRLAHAGNARTVAMRDGVPAVTDGPFGESKEVLASLWEIDVESLDRALEIAGVLTPYATVEVRPLMDAAGMEM